MLIKTVKRLVACNSVKWIDSIKRDSSKRCITKDNDIPSMVYYHKPMHQQLAFGENPEYVDGEITERLSDTVLSLPMHLYLTDEDIHKVVNTVKDFFKNIN